MDDYLERAVGAALSAGRLLLEERPADLAVDAKSSATDAVTEMDRRSEALLAQLLIRDGDAMLGEEGGERPGT